jgi:hypothetical protein
LISVESRKAWSIFTQQIVRENKEGCVKDKSSKKSKSKSKTKRPPSLRWRVSIAF